MSRQPADLPPGLPRPWQGYRTQSWHGWSWAWEVPGGPCVVRDRQGKVVARAPDWMVAARWACGQRPEGEGIARG